LTFHNILTIYNCAILPVITYASEAWCTSISKKAKGKLQQIQRAYLIFTTKAYKTVSNEALSAIAGIMPIEQAIQLYKDKRAISRGKPTHAVITALKHLETPRKNRHPLQRQLRKGRSVRCRGQSKLDNIHRWVKNCKSRGSKCGSAKRLPRKLT
jgi:hypothetical protein